MSKFKVAAFAVALAGGVMALAPVDAQAQGYGSHGYGHNGGYNYGYAPQPQYVHPRVARKQAQLQERFVEKFGYVQPQYNYGRQHHYRQNHYGYQHQYQPRGHSYSFSW
jgi:hypothetical protein